MRQVKRVTGRFAPSPTGRMHLGNVFSALLSWLSARRQGGRWLLRIEDIDPQRSRQEYADWLMNDLEWLGLTWDETPIYQSQRSDVYQHYFDVLSSRGLTYPCYCTRGDLLATQAPHESDGRVVYPGTCRGRSPQPDVAAATRLVVPDEAIVFTDGHYGRQEVNLARHVGDFIIRRKDGAWAYQLAVVVDDGLAGVNEVVRGRDLLLSTPQQLYLGGLLGFPSPRFVHLPLLCNNAGQRLSKRDRSLDMGCLRQRFQPAELIGRLAYSAGLTTELQPVTAQQLLSVFDWQKIPTTDLTITFS